MDLGLCTASLAGRFLYELLDAWLDFDRKLALSYTKDETPSILAFSETLQLQATADAEETTSSEYQTHLTTFLSSLVFWQDFLEHCTSVDVKQTLLDHFQFLFLGQLL